MPGVDPQPGLSFEHGGNPRKRPEIIGEAVGLGAFGEELAQGLAVGFLDLGWLSQGRRFHASLPLVSKARRQRNAVGVETSHCRATSAWVTPRASNAMPFFRRASMASRLRLVGRGFRFSDFVTPMR
jgi:hypothetical protein